MEEQVSLDPDDWESAKGLGHTIVDEMYEYLRTTRTRKVWQPVPQELLSYFTSNLPIEGQDLESIYAEFKQNILPYPTGNIHPRFWGWVHGGGTATGAMAEFMAAIMNPNTGGRNHGANLVEKQVLTWCKQMLGYPLHASGLLTSGCSMANLTGLAVALNHHAPIDLREEGLLGLKKRMVVYGSTQMHSSNQKAVEVLGLGRQSLHQIPVDDAFRINLDALRTQIERDLEQGMQPFCIIANVGTVNTGAIDDLHSLHELCTEYGLWLHVDGAFGSMIKLSSKYQHLVGDLAVADSLAFDMHKWLSVPYEVGCILVKDEAAHLKTFSLRPAYLAAIDRGIGAGGRWATEYGLELSRGFRALKVWMQLKEFGIKKYDQIITQNIDQAQYFVSLVESNDKLQLEAPAPTNVVCFRYIRQGLTNDQLSALNQEILMQLHEQGIAAPSNTYIQDHFVLRIAHVNHRSVFGDFDLLIKAVVNIGDSLP